MAVWMVREHEINSLEIEIELISKNQDPMSYFPKARSSKKKKCRKKVGRLIV